MKQNNHADTDLSDPLLIAGVYRNYNKHNLNPERIEEIDIHVYPFPAIRLPKWTQ